MKVKYLVGYLPIFFYGRVLEILSFAIIKKTFVVYYMPFFPFDQSLNVSFRVLLRERRRGLLGLAPSLDFF